jgi:outer membrane cobalamin receptor
MKNINELNLTGTYTLNDTFGLYLKLNNVLFQKYELYYGYPMQSFSAMIGVNINF